MNTSLIILIVLVTVILIAILLTSPTCKNAVASIRGKSKSSPPVMTPKNKPQAPAKKNKLSPQKNTLTNKQTPQKKSVSNKKARNVVSESNEENMHPRDRARARREERLKGRQSQPSEPTPEVVPSAPSSEVVEQHKKALDHFEGAQVIVNKASDFKVLSGRIENMFDVEKDEGSEFGLTEKQLDDMARAYKKEYLDAPKVEVPRHRSVNRRELENAENMTRTSFAQMAANGRRDAEDEFVDNKFKDLVMGAEQTPKVKTAFRARR